MSNWKEHPYLFANEHFCIRYENEDYTLIGIEWGNLKIWNSKQDVEKGVFRANCQLIARPIEDMTDEEGTKFIRMMGFDDMTYEEWRADREDFMWGVAGRSEYTPLQEMKKFIENYTPATLGALSIGVYPFSDTEDVIFKPK